jgi:antitoxin (DNA-binding transcriptional repressor) of toxin-antitoxin stability system
VSAVVSATEANRSFSALLREVVRGQTFTVLSHRRPVATLDPASASRAGMAASRRVLLVRLASQTASREPRTWRREELYN